MPVSPKDRLILENKYDIITLISRAINEAEAWHETATRLDDAHKYVQQYCMDDGWGRNVWHTILNDAIRMRNEKE